MFDSARPAESSDAVRLHELAEAYDADWRPENWDRMVELTRQAPAHLASAVARELILIDVQRRAARQLTLPTIQSYLARFPELGESDLGERVREALGVPGAPAPLGPPADPPPPAKIGRYPVNSALAAGGEAQVYLCYHPDWKKQVVVKWMRADAAARGDWTERFARQGELLKGLEHGNIVRVFDQGEFEGRPFIVTEYIEGRTLDQYARDVRPDPEQAADIVAGVAAALGHAHRSGVYHQDVKPGNILIDALGRVRLIDFGVAWFRPAWGGGVDPHGCTAGTLAYLSPEQANGGEVTARTDLFALGGVLYFLLTGQAPYPATDVSAALRRARAGDWDRAPLQGPGVPARLRHVCETAMATDPAARYPSAAALAAEALAAVRRPWFQSPRRVAIALLLLCVFALSVAAGLSLSRRAPEAPVAAGKADLRVLVKRPGFDVHPLGEVVPLRGGDALQARFRVPAGTHACLVHVNATGVLQVLQTYEPKGTTGETIWPASGNGSEVVPPAGTEVLFVCGRADRPPTAAEIQDAWAGGPALPALEPPDRLVRIHPETVTVEKAGPRGLGGVVEFPENDPALRRLEQFRERLRGLTVLDGVAYRLE